MEDIPFIFAATRYEGFNDGMLWEPPASIEEMTPPFHRSIKAWEEGRGFTFSIVRKDLNKFAGRISIRETAEEEVWNVGFFTHPEEQGKGIMTEALKAVLAFGFETLGATSITAAYATWNKASERVLQKNGFEFVEFIEKGFQKRGEWVAENLLAIHRKNW